MQDYRKLYVWQKAHQLAIDTYTLPQYFFKPEAWPLRDQIMKAAISIPSQYRRRRGPWLEPGLLPSVLVLAGFLQRARVAIAARARREVHQGRRSSASRERRLQRPPECWHASFRPSDDSHRGRRYQQRITGNRQPATG